MTMAISTIDNDEGEKQTAENLDETDKAKVTELASEIEVLKREKQELSDENSAVQEKLKKLSLEVNQLRDKEEEMRGEMADWEKDKEELESARKKAAELKTNVLRLRDDLSASSPDVDLNKKMTELKTEVAEKVLLIEGLHEENEELKKQRIEDEMKPKIDELNRKIEELESVAAKTRIELNLSEEEKMKSDMNAKRLELKLSKLQKQLEERVSEAEVVAVHGQSRDIVGSLGLNVPLVVASLAGVAAVLLYLFCRKRS